MAAQNKAFDINEFDKLVSENSARGLDYAKGRSLSCVYTLWEQHRGVYNWVKSNVTNQDDLASFAKYILQKANAAGAEEINTADHYDMWKRQQKVAELAATAPNPDTESKMAAGESTSPQMGAAVAGAASSVTSYAGGVVNSAAGALGAGISAAGVASSLASLVLTETVSYISAATTMIAQAGAAYTARLTADTPKKMASYIVAMLPEMTKGLPDYTSPANLTDEINAEKAQAAQKAAKMKEATSKITDATSKVNGVMQIAQQKISYITKYAGDGPKKLEELGQNALSSALSYVGDIRDKAIKQIADWEEKTSNVLAYDMAQKQARKQADKINAQTKKAADELNKVKAKATIIAKKATAVALSKIAALVGI